jgi:hypothetical protein
MKIEPDTPEFAVPVCRAKYPLDPEEVPSAVCIIISPLEVVKLAPLRIFTVPPVFVMLSPP